MLRESKIFSDANWQNSQRGGEVDFSVVLLLEDCDITAIVNSEEMFRAQNLPSILK